MYIFRDYYKRSDEYSINYENFYDENYENFEEECYRNFEDYDENYDEYENKELDPYTDGLNDSSNDPEMPIDSEQLQELELMKSMGLPTSFGSKVINYLTSVTYSSFHCK